MSQALLLDGNAAAAVLLDSLKSDIEALSPHLTIVQVGNDPASDSYIRKKVESAARIGMRCTHQTLAEETTYDELRGVIHTLNANDDVTGYIIQLPLPAHLHKMQPQLFREIDPGKDVDGFTAYNIGKMFLSTEFEHLAPATPAGIISLLGHYDIEVSGKTAVIVGQSNIVGKPLSIMLKNRGATTINCDEFTDPIELADLCKRYGDILISAVGKAGLINGAMVKEGAIVIDVGLNRDDDDELVGDIDFESVSKVAGALTPVPGGVGPMTVAALLRNCVSAARRQKEKSSRVS